MRHRFVIEIVPVIGSMDSDLAYVAPYLSQLFQMNELSNCEVCKMQTKLGRRARSFV